MSWLEIVRNVLSVVGPLAAVLVPLWGVLRGDRLIKEVRDLAELRGSLAPAAQAEADAIICRQLEQIRARREREINWVNLSTVLVVAVVTGGGAFALLTWAMAVSGVVRFVLYGVVAIWCLFGFALAGAGVGRIFDTAEMSAQRKPEADERKRAKRG